MSRIKLNPEVAFYPGLYDTPMSRIEIMKSSLFPLALAAHYIMDGRLYIAHANVNPKETFRKITLCNINGLPVITLCESPAKYTIRLWNSPLTGNDSNFYGVAAETVNSTYLVKRLGVQKTTHGRRKSLNQVIKAAIDNADQIVDSIFDEAVKVYARREAPHVAHDAYAVNVPAQEWALLVAFGRKQIVEVPQDIRLVMERAFNHYDSLTAQTDAIRAKAVDMFGIDKWVAFHLPGLGVSIGKVNLGKLVEWVMTYNKEGYVPNRSASSVRQLQMIEPFKLYRSFDSYPVAQGRDKLIANLIYAKANRADGIKYKDAEQFIPEAMLNSPLIQTGIGSMSWHNDQGYFTMVDA